MTHPPPACPACGSSATLPFESERHAGGGPPAADLVLGALLPLLLLLALLLFFLLARASLPAAMLLLLGTGLYGRRRLEAARCRRQRPRRRVCLDCGHSFRA